ncbi:MAG: ATP-binding protein, partial [Bacteroidota bacterium]
VIHILWLTTVNGVYVLDGKTLTHYSPNSGISDNEVWSINQDNDNNIWIGTEKGIDLMKTKGDSLPISPIFKSFKEIDGLKTQDNIANSSFLNENQLWWGMGKNVLQLDLDKFYNSIDTTPPNIFLNSIKLNDQFFDFSKTNQTKLSEGSIKYESSNKFQNYPNELVVDYKTNHFTFNFAALEWSAPHDVRYRYLLEGLEKEWSAPKKENKIDYRGLTHGKYTFNVQAKGKWSDWGAPLSYSFRIRPPWWFTWWAYVIYGLLFSALVYGIFQFLRRRLHLRNQLELEQKEAQRLKELDSFKSRLYTNLTHEFRTPLTVILGMTQQIRNEPKQFLDTGTQLIERNGKNLLRLINQLLDLSKLEDKSFQLNLQQSDIVAYLRYLTESFQTYTNSENLSLQFLSTLEQLQMDYDPEQLQQIMTNLISNAVKYTPSGGAIKVKLKRIEQQLQLEIHDTGIGIAAADLSHIFDRFYQVDDSATRKEEGTGIGLAHTRELVQLMGGEIHVKSELGKGSVFIINLPIVVSDELKRMNHAAPQKLASMDTIPLYSLDKERTDSSLSSHHSSLQPQLLIIEDNPDVVTYLKACLTKLYQIDVAYNGKVGIEKAVEAIPDLIISDVMMPEKDGYEVCDVLKNDERTSHIPIILLTAKADADSKIVGLRRGADAYLTKPFDKEELLVRLEMMVEKQQKIAAYFSQDTNTVADIVEEDVQIEHEFIQKVRSIVERHYTDDRFGLPQLCQKVGMSRSQLYRKMKALINIAPSDFIRTYRLQQAKRLLETTDLNVSEVVWEVGFTNLPHFSKIFQEEFGVSPSATSK